MTGKTQVPPAPDLPRTGAKTHGNQTGKAYTLAPATPNSCAGNCGPTTVIEITHPYNDPGLDALGFLRAVVHDQNTELQHRMRAAEILLRVDPDNNVVWSEGPTYRIGHA